MKRVARILDDVDASLLVAFGAGNGPDEPWRGRAGRLRDGVASGAGETGECHDGPKHGPERTSTHSPSYHHSRPRSIFRVPGPARQTGEPAVEEGDVTVAREGSVLTPERRAGSGPLRASTRPGAVLAEGHFAGTPFTEESSQLLDGLVIEDLGERLLAEIPQDVFSVVVEATRNDPTIPEDDDGLPRPAADRIPDRVLRISHDLLDSLRGAVPRIGGLDSHRFHTALPVCPELLPIRLRSLAWRYSSS